MLKRFLQQAELMDRMLERIGVDLDTAARLEKGIAWCKARSQNIACRSERPCQEWLMRAPTGAPGGATDFRGNSAFFFRCELSAPGRLILDGGAQ